MWGSFDLGIQAVTVKKYHALQGDEESVDAKTELIHHFSDSLILDVQDFERCVGIE
jgi:hypothetical protein